MFKYQKQYRLPEFNYSSNNAYFITICTKNREHFFGTISNEEIYFTEIGIQTESLLKSVNEKIKHLKIHAFVVMPNHVHFVAVINNPDYKEIEWKRGIHPLIEKSISSFSNHFKGKVKRWCNENGFENFEWQARFNDRVIRDRDEYFAIINYIKNNVKNWKDDSDNQENPNFKKD